MLTAPENLSLPKELGPAISEAAELGRRYAQRDVATPTSRWSEARPR